jgi:hypothetical protein
MSERHVTNSKVIEDPENSQTVPDTVTTFHTDQRGYAILFVRFYYLWNKENIVNWNGRQYV